jgi:hypothetical protein
MATVQVLREYPGGDGGASNFLSWSFQEEDFMPAETAGHP